MNKKKRWLLAQKNEKAWWGRTIVTNDLSYFAAFARECVGICGPFVSFSPQTRILEVGSGPAGILTHVKAGFRCGIDPLEPFFRRSEQCRRLRDPAVRYAAAQAEHLPFDENSFDLVIMDNILDHCEDCGLVFRELARVCAPHGIVYLRNFTCTRWGAFLANLLEFLRIDRGHPYHFGKRELLRLIAEYGFQVILLQENGFLKHQRKLFASKKMSHVLRALSFSQADKVLFLVKNNKRQAVVSV